MLVLLLPPSKNASIFLHGTSAILRTFGSGVKSKGFWRAMASKRRPSAPLKNSSEQKPWEDKVLRELYAQRDQYAAALGYDMDRIGADLMKRSAESQMRRLNSKTKPR